MTVQTRNTSTQKKVQKESKKKREKTKLTNQKQLEIFQLLYITTMSYIRYRASNSDFDVRKP